MHRYMYSTRTCKSTGSDKSSGPGYISERFCFLTGARIIIIKLFKEFKKFNEQAIKKTALNYILSNALTFIFSSFCRIQPLAHSGLSNFWVVSIVTVKYTLQSEYISQFVRWTRFFSPDLLINSWTVNNWCYITLVLFFKWLRRREKHLKER